MRKLLLVVTVIATSLLVGSPGANAETTECTEIKALPATISTQGIYCFKKNLVTAITSGNAITINTNNVTIDLNGWKLGGAAAGAGTNANGIYALDRKNIVIRNGSIRGFYYGINVDQFSGTSSGHIIEHIFADGNRFAGIWIHGDNTTIRNNTVTNTGSGSSNSAYGIRAVNGKGISIFGNTVSGVDETVSVHGVVVAFVANAEVRNNRVFDLKTAIDKYGVVAASASRVAFKDNTVSTDFGGTTGIGEFNTSTHIACVDNQVTGFTLSISGCDANSGNVSF